MNIIRLIVINVTQLRRYECELLNSTISFPNKVKVIKVSKVNENNIKMLLNPEIQ